ncbi:hypothetical protein Pcinc_015343 [Petrolisthes cinctipes]|uniref:Uncharacterized protein n=1 Tax=Petrolisthes cinctipes TaxID=88211 RepID=A0AAE1FV62_PETCI|nr:hypothetical protein Pcinc_015343 [Petrolisthes cinctipes]
MKGSVENKRQKASRWVYCFWWSWLRDGHAHSFGPHRFHRGSRDETGSLNDVGCIGLPGSCSTKVRLVACPPGTALFHRWKYTPAEVHPEEAHKARVG